MKIRTTWAKKRRQRFTSPNRNITLKITDRHTSGLNSRIKAAIRSTCVTFVLLTFACGSKVANVGPSTIFGFGLKQTQQLRDGFPNFGTNNLIVSNNKSPFDCARHQLHRKVTRKVTIWRSLFVVKYFYNIQYHNKLKQ